MAAGRLSSALLVFNGCVIKDSAWVRHFNWVFSRTAALRTLALISMSMRAERGRYTPQVVKLVMAIGCITEPAAA
jgi:hypothetical protein